jgi:catechol 2,3-dioxygenase-like lactoylglutathione lyase family enzyme
VLGEFLEISLSTDDILASVQFYEKLGFSQASVGATWKHPYAVMTDGRLYLGLHKYEFASPALSFVLPELRTHLDKFEQLGIEFEFCKIGLEEFNEAGFLDPDGQMITLLEARTYSPVHSGHIPPSLCGYFLEYRLGARDSAASARFWEALGFVITSEEDEPVPYAQLARNRINLGLQQQKRNAPPALVFAKSDLDDTAALIEARGLDLKQTAEGLQLQSPEGTLLILRPDEI